jgi:glycosyltransferase involved in cell wall biosynthesis
VRILIVTPYLPHRSVGHGGGTAVRSLVRALAGRHEVQLVSLVRPGEEDRLGEAAPPTVPVHAVPFVDRQAHGVQRLRLLAGRMAAVPRALSTGYPFYAAKYASARLDRTVRAVAARWEPDVIQVEYLQLALLLRHLRPWRDRRRRQERPAPRLVLDSHELGSVPRRRRAAAARGLRRAALQAEARSWDRLARDASGWADATLCVTPGDLAGYRDLGGRRLVWVPLGIDTDGLASTRDPVAPPRALFLGSFGHPPNREAAALLCQHIWPAVRERLAGWELILAGPGSDGFASDLDAAGALPDGVRGVGFVDDLDALFAGSRLFVAPLFSGGGIKIKILEALARGIPTVTTPIGAEGIVEPGDDLVGWATSPGEFVDAVVAMAGDPDGAERRAGRARHHVATRFAWPAIVQRLEAVYREETPPGAPSGAAGSAGSSGSVSPDDPPPAGPTPS